MEEEEEEVTLSLKRYAKSLSRVVRCVRSRGAESVIVWQSTSPPRKK